jgi:serine/threonine protein kinase
MHTLVGCFLIHNDQLIDAHEQIGDRVYRRIELKLSQQFKRVFYVATDRELRNWIVNLKRAIGQRNVHDLYVSADLLGQGSFGKVYKGYPKSHPDQVIAIKYIDKKQMKPFEITLQLNEIEILKVLNNHPNVIRMLDFFEDAHYFYMVLEYLSGKDLFHFISINKLDERASQHVLRQLLMGMKYFHEVFGVVHRDIKLENIMMSGSTLKELLMGTAVPKFIDFGLSKVLLPGERSPDPFGTLIYCSPEIIIGKTHTKGTDIWSLGIVLYAMLTDRMPFVTFDRRETSKNIVQQRINFNQTCWQRVTNLAKDLVSRMLEKNMDTRIRIDEVL